MAEVKSMSMVHWTMIILDRRISILFKPSLKSRRFQEWDRGLHGRGKMVPVRKEREVIWFMSMIVCHQIHRESRKV